MTTRALLLVVPLLAACGDSPPAVHARQETVEALAALRSYSVDQRDAFVQEISARMALLDRQLDELKARSARASAEAKADIESELSGLQGKRGALAEQLAALQQTPRHEWVQARNATVDAFELLTDGINAAAQQFGE